MINFLEETKEVLRNNGKTFKDVKWIGTNKAFISIRRFEELANVGYDDGFGLNYYKHGLKSSWRRLVD